jgi:hypothetical protein
MLINWKHLIHLAFLRVFQTCFITLFTFRDGAFSSIFNASDIKSEYFETEWDYQLVSPLAFW